MEPSNILKIESLNDGWSDKDNIMLHACFQLLKDCIEKEELLNGHVDWNYNEDFIKAKQEIEFLYKWWIDRLMQEKSERIDPIWTENQHDTDTEMLIRLIKVRKYLWT